MNAGSDIETGTRNNLRKMRLFCLIGLKDQYFNRSTVEKFTKIREWYFVGSTSVRKFHLLSSVV